MNILKKLFNYFCIYMVCGVHFVSAINYYPESIDCESVYVVNENTNQVVIEKNVNEKRSPASLTKIMTFVVAYENTKDFNKKIKVKKEVIDKVDPESSGVKFRADEEISMMDLFHCMLISSSGYAAHIIADEIGSGDMDKFVFIMNETAEKLNLSNTHFANPDGMFDTNQYTTSKDMFTLTSYARKYTLFNEICSKSEYNCFGDKRDPVVTTNKMVDPKRGGKYYCPYVKGIKTGYLDEAGRCLISFYENNGVKYLAVVMGGKAFDENNKPINDNIAMLETKKVYEWLYKNLSIINVFPKTSPLHEIGLEYVWGKDRILLFPEDDVMLLLPKEYKTEDLEIKYDTPEKVTAPIEQNDVLGLASVYYKGEKIKDVNLISTKTYEKSLILNLLDHTKKISKSPVFIIIFGICLLFIVGYVRRSIKIRRLKKRRNRVKKFYKR